MDNIYNLFAIKYTILPHIFAVIDVYKAALVYLQIVLLSKSQKKAGNTEQDSYQRPFYCDFDSRVWFLRMHKQYPDTN